MSLFKMYSSDPDILGTISVSAIAILPAAVGTEINGIQTNTCEYRREANPQIPDIYLLVQAQHHPPGRYSKTVYDVEGVIESPTPLHGLTLRFGVPWLDANTPPVKRGTCYLVPLTPVPALRVVQVNELVGHPVQIKVTKVWRK